jgi:hypothetical protein
MPVHQTAVGILAANEHKSLLDPDDPAFVNIRVHLWLNILSKRFLNINVETALRLQTSEVGYPRIIQPIRI